MASVLEAALFGLYERTLGRAAIGAFLLVVVLGAVAGTTYALGSPAIDRVVVTTLISVVAVVGVGVFSGNGGILNFGSTAFVAIGAYAAGIATTSALIKERTLTGLPGVVARLELSFWPAILAAALVALLCTLAISIVLARLRGAGAAIGTLAWLIIVHVLLNGARSVTRGSQTFYGVPPLIGLASAFAIAAIAILAARLYRESRFGLRLRASRDDELAAEALGVNLVRERYWGLALSGTILGVAGGMSAFSLGAFSPRQFYLVLAFTYLAMLIVGGAATVTGAVAGTILVTLLTEATRRFEGGVSVLGLQLPSLFGLTQVALGIVLMLAIFWRPRGIFGRHELDELVLSRWVQPPAQAPAPAIGTSELPVPSTRKGVEVAGVSKRFGGVQALDDIHLTVEPGEILGLIGPNGSGKTTLVNVISGLIKPEAGSVVIGDRSVDRLATHNITTQGLSRTFQNIRLFTELSVLENTCVGELGAHTKGPYRDGRQRARALLGALEIQDLANRRSGGLSFAEQRRVELARALAARPSVLLLDEPAAGMNDIETSALTDLLLAIHAKTGVTMLVIEHDLSLVMRLCHRVVVLNEGEKIADGPPDEVQRDKLVLAAYLGTTEEGDLPGDQGRGDDLDVLR
jgi:branched-chain amino acid transport system permease protein